MKIIAANNKTNFDYDISFKFDAGIVLTGSEVKSLRNVSPSIKESYIEEKNSELWLTNCFIKKYLSSSDKENNPTRSRKLLVNRKELNKILGAIRRDGFSAIPIIMFFSDKGFVKLNIGLGKGKKKYDKREDQKMKDWNKNKQRLLKNN